MEVRSTLNKHRLALQAQKTEENSNNTNSTRNSSINYIGPVIGGSLASSVMGAGVAFLLVKRFRKNFFKKHNITDQKDYDKLPANLKTQIKKQLRKIWGISLSTSAAIGATLYGTVASFTKPNMQAYNFSKEEFANTKISAFRLGTGLLRDDEVHNINKYRILPKNAMAMLMPVGSGKIYFIAPDQSEYNPVNKYLPKGFMVKKSLFGFSAIYPKNYKNWLIK